MSKKPFSIRSRLQSFAYAFSGIHLMLQTQHNAWIHLLATVAVIILGLLLRINIHHWLAIILAIVLVWMAEAMNTALEFLCDVASPAFHPLVEKAKDVAAGAVLITAIGAVIIGLLVFVPQIIALVMP